MMEKVDEQCHKFQSHGNTNNMAALIIKGLTPTDNDVLCGRGKKNFLHDGNRRFREIVGKNLESYLNASSRAEKSTLVKSIADEALGTGARFLKKDQGSEHWYDGGIKTAREKVGHALRDATSAKSQSIFNFHLDRVHEKTHLNLQNNDSCARSSSSCNSSTSDVSEEGSSQYESICSSGHEGNDDVVDHAATAAVGEVPLVEHAGCCDRLDSHTKNQEVVMIPPHALDSFCLQLDFLHSEIDAYHLEEEHFERKACVWQNSMMHSHDDEPMSSFPRRFLSSWSSSNSSGWCDEVISDVIVKTDIPRGNVDDAIESPRS